MAECKKCRTKFESKCCPECGTPAGEAPPKGDPNDQDREKQFRGMIRDEVKGVLDTREADRKASRKKRPWLDRFLDPKPEDAE